MVIQGVEVVRARVTPAMLRADGESPRPPGNGKKKKYTRTCVCVCIYIYIYIRIMGRLRVMKWPSINPLIARRKCSVRLTNVCPVVFAFLIKRYFSGNWLANMVYLHSTTPPVPPFQRTTISFKFPPILVELGEIRFFNFICSLAFGSLLDGSSFTWRNEIHLEDGFRFVWREPV